jgi:hypothetical protein
MAASSRSTIRLRLRELAQLFNSLDPSPFIERDLDADAEEFITSWAREIPAGRELELVIQLTKNTATVERLQGAQSAIQSYFATRAEMKQRDLAQLMRRGRLSLAVGLVFLVVCLTGAHLAGRVAGGEAINIFQEGLTIVGWVAMWRPLEIYLYDWWPLFDERRHLQRLGRIAVTIDAIDAEKTASWPPAEAIRETNQGLAA